MPRSFVPDDEKFLELLLLFTQASPSITLSRLYQHLHNCERQAYLTLGSPISGQEYVYSNSGVVPKRGWELLNLFAQQGHLRLEQMVPDSMVHVLVLPLRPPNMTLFLDVQLGCIEAELENARQFESKEYQDLAAQYRTIRAQDRISGNLSPERQELDRKLSRFCLRDSYTMIEKMMFILTKGALPPELALFEDDIVLSKQELQWGSESRRTIQRWILRRALSRLKNSKKNYRHSPPSQN